MQRNRPFSQASGKVVLHDAAFTLHAPSLHRYGRVGAGQAANIGQVWAAEPAVTAGKHDPSEQRNSPAEHKEAVRSVLLGLKGVAYLVPCFNAKQFTLDDEHDPSKQRKGVGYRHASGWV